MMRIVKTAKHRHAAPSFAACLLAALLCPPPTAAQTLAWDPSPDPNVAGYLLHVGQASGLYDYSINVGQATSHPLPPVAANRTHYFAVTAYSTSGAYSGYSNEVALAREVADAIPLAADFAATPTGGFAPLTVRFSPWASGAVLWYRWELGDGSAVTGTELPLADLTHTYERTGEYAATFTVAGPAGQQVAQGPAAIRVLEAPRADTCPCTMWESTEPRTADDRSPEPINVGMRFTSSRDGYVTALRFFKSPANVGPHVGSLWTDDGTLLGSVAFAAGASSGWQEAFFATPIPITARGVYVASYHAPNGHVARDDGAFLKNVVSGPLLAPAHRVGAGNGRYAYGPPTTFPRRGDKQTNFWVDVVFVPID